jgi:hypothetical protein
MASVIELKARNFYNFVLDEHAHLEPIPPIATHDGWQVILRKQPSAAALLDLLRYVRANFSYTEKICTITFF